MLKAASLAIIEQLESQGAYNYDATKGVDGRGGYEPRRDWEFGSMIMQECPDGNVDLHALFPILNTLFTDAKSDKLYQKGIK
ncbi:hypothetical protein NC651_011039 [Populus alba x Populus x berolinensis]|nr:hypothetical protein NC651_011039 [Populus alba x Populus x berolinensis]